MEASFYKLLSLASRTDYIFPIRLHYSTYVYKCGMLVEKCTQLLLALDGVLSYGDEEIKARRKRLVLRIQLLLKFGSRLTVGAVLWT